MARKRITQKRRASQSKAAPAGRIKRFTRSLVLSAIASFSIAVFGLHPDLRDALTLDSLYGRFVSPPEPIQLTGQYVQTRFSECPQFFPGQTPVVPATVTLRELCFSSFAILHSGQTKTPVFVAQRLNRKMFSGARPARTNRFYEEARLPQAERAQLTDYRNSGFSRGHMAPAGDMHTAEGMAQSFSLANMVPQYQQHNAGAWSKAEQDTRNYVMRAQGDVYVFTGPVYDEAPARIGQGRVAVPSYLFKLVYDASNGRTWVHWHRHSPSTTTQAPISYREFVQRTGLHLLPAQR